MEQRRDSFGKKPKGLVTSQQKDMKLMLALLVMMMMFGCAQEGTSTDIRQKAKEAIQAQADKAYEKEGENQNIQINLPKGKISSGGTRCFDVTTGSFKAIMAMQYTISWDKNILAFSEVKNFKLPNMGKDNFGTTFASEGKLTSVWIEDALQGVSYPDGTALFQLCFQALGKPGQSTDLILSSNPTPVEIVANGDKILGVETAKGNIAIE